MIFRTLGICIFAIGCISISATTVDRKTALERQFIGEFEDLSDDLQTTASARAAAGDMGDDGDDPYWRALQARRLQIFYGDDLADAEAAGCIGERNDGRVEKRACANPTEPSVDRLVHIENAAREGLVAYALARQTQVEDKNAMWRAYHRVVVAHVKKGTWVQDDGGKWSAN
jgi:uncharacterized protein YdbL (DUF1318 family)